MSGKHLSECCISEVFLGFAESPVSHSWLISFLKWLKLLMVPSSSILVVHSGEFSWEPSYKKSKAVVFFFFFFCLPKIPGVSMALRPVFMLVSRCVKSQFILLSLYYHMPTYRTAVLIFCGWFFLLSKNLSRRQASWPRFSELDRWATRTESRGFVMAFGRCRGHRSVSPGKHRPHPRTPAFRLRALPPGHPLWVPQPRPALLWQENSLPLDSLGALVFVVVVVIFSATFLCVYC